MPLTTQWEHIEPVSQATDLQLCCESPAEGWQETGCGSPLPFRAGAIP